MATQTLNVFFSGIPTNTPPSTWIRRVDSALIAGVSVFLMVDALLSWVLWRPLFGHVVPDGDFLSQLIGYPCLLLSQMSGGYLFRDAVPDNPAAFDLLAVHLRLFPALLISLLAGAYVFADGLRPFRRIKHIDGPQLLRGKQAIEAAQRLSAKELEGKETFMYLHPLLPLPKQVWTRGVLLYGSPGSGKTLALIPIIQQLIEANHRSFIYDVKGDFSSYWLGGSIGLVCPWDSRSLVWDIGRDVRTPSQAKAFVQALIPDGEGDGRFWASAAQQLLEGTILSLQNELGPNWGASTLGERLSVDARAMAERMERHAPAAKNLIADEKGQTTNSILATLTGYTSIVQSLAVAWGDGRDDSGAMRPSIAFTEWAKDWYAGKHRQIIFQAGPDPSMTTALGSAIFNVLTPQLLSAALPDDEIQRTLAFVIDEMSSLGPIPFQGLIERGRSRGIIFVGAVQTLEQIKMVWGEETMKSLGAMIGTHVVFRVQQSASRDTIAEQFGKARWAVTATSSSSSGTGGAGSNTSLHEEMRAVVNPHELSELGPFKKKRLPFGWGANNKNFPLGWGVSAMVAIGGGGDVLQLEFPGVSPEKRRTPHRPAKWTRGPANPGMTPEPSAAQRLAKREAEGTARDFAWADAKSSKPGRPPPRRDRKPADVPAPVIAADPEADPFVEAASVEPTPPAASPAGAGRARDRILAEKDTSALAALAASMDEGTKRG